MPNTSRRILSAALIVAVLSLAAKLLATGKDSLIAFRLGTNPQLDAFVLAYMVPAFVTNVLAGSTASAFVPVFVREGVEKGAVAAGRLLGCTTAWMATALCLGACLAAPLVAIGLPLAAGSLAPGTVRDAVNFTYLLMMLLPLIGVAALWTAALNANGQFALAGLASLLTPLTVIIALWVSWDFLGIFAVLLGHLLGAALELAVVGAAVRRAGLPLVLWQKPLPPARHVIGRQFLPAAAGGVLMGSTLLVDQVMAASLGPGSVSAFLYASKVTGALLSIGSMALATALLPHLSRMVASGQIAMMRRVLWQYVALVVIVSAVLTAALIALSTPLVHLLFQRGAFTPEDTAVVSTIQKYLLLQILPFSLGVIAVRLVNALGANQILMYGALINGVVNVVLNWLLMRWMGIAGIALSTSIVYLVSCVFLWYHALRRLRQSGPRERGVTSGALQGE